MAAFDVFLEGRHDGFFAAQTLFLDFLERLEHTRVILRQHLYELGNIILPVRENFGRPVALGVGLMALHQLPHFLDFVGIG